MLNSTQSWNHVLRVSIVNVSNVQLSPFDAENLPVHVRLLCGSDNEKTKSVQLSAAPNRQASIKESFTFYSKSLLQKNLILELFKTSFGEIIGQ